MGAKKKISKHPNPYVLAEEMITQLSEASDTVVAKTLTSHSKKLDPRIETLRKRKKGLMKDLKKRNIDLETYLASMGANTIKYQPMMLVDPDPLADIASNSEEEDDPVQENEEMVQDLGEDPTPSGHPSLPDLPSYHAPPVQPSRPGATSHPVPVRPQHNKKGKRKKQKAVPNSEDSFIHIESLADIDVPFQASIGGEELRELRRQVPDDTEDTGYSLLTGAALASAGISVLSRFMARSSASKSPRRSSLGRRASGIQRPSNPNPPSSPVSSDLYSTAKFRVQSLGFRFSSSQPFTKGDGNCMLYAIWDQLHKCRHPAVQSLKTPHNLRLLVCSKLNEQLEEDLIFWVENFTPESWLEKMQKDRLGVMMYFYKLLQILSTKTLF